MSGVDFSDLGDTTTSFEVDVYGGRHFALAGTQLTLEGMYSFFPDNDIPGPTYNFLTMKTRLQRVIQRTSVGASAAWTPDGPYDAGPAWRATAEASYRLASWLSASGQIGRRWSERNVDRSFWDVGGTTTWKQMTIDLRYFDTDLDFEECGFVNWCEPGVVARVQVDCGGEAIFRHRRPPPDPGSRGWTFGSWIDCGCGA